MDDVETMKLVFLRHVLEDMARADNVLTPDELAMIDRLCPPAQMREAGLLDDKDQLTPLGTELRNRAIDELPRVLPLEDRLAMVTSLVELAIVDGQLDRNEGSLLYLAATLLGVETVFDDHLDSLTDHVTSIDIGQPEA